MENLASGHSNNLTWKKILQEALVETNSDKLKVKVAEAEATIFQRLQSLGQGPETLEERRALQDASNTLLSLKREVLKFPDCRGE